MKELKVKIETGMCFAWNVKRGVCWRVFIDPAINETGHVL
jgi:hypothetical protein